MPGVLTVGCKLPNGITIRKYVLKERPEQKPGGGTVMIMAPEFTGETITIKGNAVAFGVIPEHATVGGYALTPNVDADSFEQWLKDNANSDLVRNKIIVSHTKDTAGLARENKDRRTGLEPRDPDRPGVGIGLKPGETIGALTPGAS